MARYTLDYKYERTYCPNCKRKSYTYLYDLKLNEVTEFGICSRRNKCGYKFFPEKRTLSDCKTVKNQVIIQQETKITVDCFEKYDLIDYDKKEFTVIEPPANKCLAKYNVSLNELLILTNNLPLDASKFESLNVLKGLYQPKKTTNGVDCFQNSDFLFFDIDFNEEKGLNTFLTNAQIRERVKKELENVSVLVFDSYSKKGMGGILYVHGLSKIENSEKELHFAIAKEVYKHLSELILKATNIEVEFDPQQGKFRQVRLVPRQSYVLRKNLAPNIFCFSVC